MGITLIMERPLVIDYSDRISTVSLWWKAFLIAPVWGYFAILFLGLISYFGGIGTVQVAYIAAMSFFLLYFVKDVLDRKIRIEKGIIQHGFFNHDLSSLRSLGTAYRRKQALPTEMVFTFRSGKTLKLRLSCLKFKDYESLLRFVENKYPHCQIDPVLSTLVRCKEVARQILVDDADSVIIQYDSHQKFKQFLETFTETANPWLRVGPVLVSIILCPVWIGASSGTFWLGYQWEAKKMGMDWLFRIMEFFGRIDGQVGQLVTSTGSSLALASKDPFFLTAVVVTTGFILFYLSLLALRPTAISLDIEGLSVNFAVGSLVKTVRRMLWQDVLSVRLIKTDTFRGEVLAIRFKRRNGKDFDIDFSAVTTADRSRLMKSLERFAPNCMVDAELAEAMMPKQQHSYTEIWLQSLSGNPERNSSQPLLPGKQLQENRYFVEKRLGVGGQGTAYLCKDTISGAKVVLKETIIPVFADRIVKEQALKRFESEAFLLRKLESEQVVKMEDYFFEDHRGYIVLEHVDGSNLRQAVNQDGPMKEERVIELAVEMCEILACLHEQSIIHRDFTPDNLMLTKGGKLKLIDFNVAQIEQVGATGTIAGKHAYLPPEQFRGKATLQSDIYAFGATLFFLLTGRDPEAISCSSPKDVLATVSEELDALIKNCTDLRLDHRLKSAEEAKERLQAMITTPLAIEETSEIELAEAIAISILKKDLERREA
jgi:tRNA A-37 threonylcarbamoyl transferase component Bud32